MAKCVCMCLIIIPLCNMKKWVKKLAVNFSPYNLFSVSCQPKTLIAGQYIASYGGRDPPSLQIKEPLQTKSHSGSGGK